MARLTESLTIKTGLGQTYDFNLEETYTEIFSKRQIVDNSDGFITISSFSKDFLKLILKHLLKLLILYHQSNLYLS